MVYIYNEIQCSYTKWGSSVYIDNMMSTMYIKLKTKVKLCVQCTTILQTKVVKVCVHNSGTNGHRWKAEL